jgi:hypothetical protein
MENEQKHGVINRFGLPLGDDPFLAFGEIVAAVVMCSVCIM